MTNAKQYAPPYTVTAKIIALISEVSQALGRLSADQSRQPSLTLRRINRIRTIHGSLAIEGNTLTIAEITALLDGKRVIAPPREIQEARNAIKAYDFFLHWQPTNEDDLLSAHQTLMQGLLDAPGRYRRRGVGVMSGKDVIHMAPPAKRVPQLMHDLLSWLGSTDAHPLIASAVFHYEFEFIHPFEDGNGRMGRLWQTRILANWHPLLANIPVESLVHDNQAAYYQAIRDSTDKTDASPFITFMLCMLLNAISTSVAAPQVDPQVTPQVERLIRVMSASKLGGFSRDQLQRLLNLADRKSFQLRYLQAAVSQGLVEHTLPTKPTSRLQQYRLTAAGIALKRKLAK
jgi:Fic family protein